ncbi:hypothetical protein [Kitasatospora sp. NPDC085879]|uniref:hypothetical protein n=1 Tax=Kitasatospora sp. NPDC085879 TaxID=3154769 RepID=UPI00341E26C0
MPEQYRVVDASVVRVGPTECWQVRQQRPDGGHHVTVFPTSSLEWRAAEYDIDHTTAAGINQILDILLHEPFVPDPIEHRERDPAAAKGFTAPSTQALHGLQVGEEAPITLHNAPDRATARAAHLERIAHTKRTRIHVVPSTPTATKRTASSPARDPLDLIRANHGITTAGVAAKTALVEQARQQLGATQAPVPAEASTPPTFPATFTTPMWDSAVPRRDDAHRRDSGDDTA